MQITPKEQKGLSHQFSVVVSANEIDRQMEVELQAIGQKAKMPGFRPGKVPMPVLKQRYGKDVMNDVLQNAITKATRDTVEQRKLRPAMQPDVKITHFEIGGDLTFDLTVEVMPEIPAVDFAAITVDELTYKIPETEVTTGLEHLAKSRQHTHKEEGAAKTGHVVKIDFLGKIDGTPFNGGSAKGFFLELGSNQFIPGFEEQLVGTKAGDAREVKVTFPEDYHSENLAGKDAVFDVTVHEVHRLHVPEVDDKLAKSLGFKDLESLKGAVRQQIEFEFARTARSRAKKQLFDALDALLGFAVPEKMLTLEFDAVWKQVEQAKKSGDPALKDKPDEALKKEYQAIAERRVKLGIFLAETGRMNSLQITREELSAAVMTQARNYPGQEEKVFEFYRKNPNQVEELKGPILEEKAVDLILAKVTRLKKPVTIEELMQEEDSDVAAKPAKASAAKPAAKAAKKPAKKKT